MCVMESPGANWFPPLLIRLFVVYTKAPFHVSTLMDTCQRFPVTRGRHGCMPAGPSRLLFCTALDLSRLTMRVDMGAA